MIPVRFKKPWNGFDVGEARLPDGYEGVAEELARQGVIEFARPTPPPTPKADETPRGRSRGTRTVHA